MTAAPRPFPLGALIGAFGLIGVGIASALVARTTGIGTTRMPDAAAVATRDLRFEDRADGAVTVTDVRDGHLVAVLAPGTNGFARGVLRGFARERKRHEVGVYPAFKLVRWSDGRLSLEDPTTGAHVSLEAFGMTNAAVFAHLMNAQGETP